MALSQIWPCLLTLLPSLVNITKHNAAQGPMRHCNSEDKDRIEAIKRQVQSLDLICSGTLLEQTKTGLFQNL